ncbi:hypothetical protein DYB32_002897 [Aphanomyces invadans]|uniref:EF-hand domain-containing protein n=1 Tax=Aphanomyces invadans TaxID=157072 RepID=A0A3R6VPT9_9STRA|nr:hypothetical protein DYB32_002897 [Aphanomyces invadans]
MPTATVAEKDAALFAEEESRHIHAEKEIEELRILDGYLFVPPSLRHDFKHVATNSRRDVTAARYARSARLFYHNNQHLRGTLYPADVETMIGARVYYERALVKLADVEASAGSKTLLQLQRQVVSLVQQCLKSGQCDIYIGLVQPKRSHLLYTASSSNSGMLGKSLLSTEGVSFHSVVNQFTLGVYRVASRSKVLELVGALRDGVPLHLPTPPTWFTQEPPSMAFLEEVAARAGKVFYRAQLRDWHRKLATTTVDGLCTQYNVYNTAIQAILHCILMVDSVTIWRLEGHRQFPPAHQVHVLAACDTPLDRLAPFVNSYDKGIKRMQLYKEHGGGRPSMLRANITRIGTHNANAAHLPADPFMVTWSDQSTEDLSWTDLQQLLPIRPLNTQHHQLQKLIAHVEMQTDVVMTVDGGASKWLRTFKDNDDRFTYVLDMTFQPSSPSPRDCAGSFVSQMILPTMEEALVCVRGRQRRSAARAKSMKVMRKAIAQLSMSPSSDALRSATDLVAAMAAEVVSCLPGVEIGVAELRPGGTSVEFTFGFNGCLLAERRTVLERGAALACLKQPRMSSIIRCLDAAVGLECFITPDAVDASLPLILLPMVHEESAVGVVTVYRFTDVEKGRSDETHPECGVIAFLECTAKCIAAVLRIKRRAHALYELEAMARNAFMSPLELYVATMRTMVSCFVGLHKPKFVQYDKPSAHAAAVLDCAAFEWNMVDVQYVDALRDVRRRETRLETFQQYFRLDDSTMRYIEARLGAPPSPPVLSGHLATLSDTVHPVVIDRKLHTSIDAAFKIVFGNQVYVQAWVPALCTSTTFVALTYTTTTDWVCKSDDRFLETLAHSLSRVLTTVQGRYDRVRGRVAALSVFQGQCRDVQPVDLVMPTVDTELDAEIRPDVQRWAVDSIAATLTGSNVYIGMVEPSRKRITYTCASRASCMVGKHLNMGKGVSFQCLASQMPLVLDGSNNQLDQGADADAARCDQLRHFGDPKAFQWPFIVVPIGTIGVLALDNLAQYGEAPAPEMGIVDYLVRVAGEIEVMVQGSRAQTRPYRATLRDRAIHDMMVVCDNGRHSEAYVLQRALDIVAATFSGVNAYVGLVAPWCTSMEFALATKASSMQGKSINMTKSVSAACYRSQHPVVVPNVAKNPNGLHCFDQNQAGVYVAVPIPYVGVLAVDSFPGTAGGKYMNNVPEPGVVACLSSLAESVGAHIQAKRLWGLAQGIKRLFVGNASTFAVLFQAVANLLAFAMPAAIRIDVWYAYHNHPPELKFSRASDVHATPLEATHSWANVYPDAPVVGTAPLDLNESTLVCPFEMVDPAHPYTQTHAWIVVTRLPSVNWSYDLHVLATVQPLLTECFHLSSQRAAAAVTRAECLDRMRMGLEELVQTPTDVVVEHLRPTQRTWLNWMATALGRGTDVYLGELQANYHPFRGDYNDVLEFTAASAGSLMQGVRLSDENLFSFQCIRTQDSVVINHLTDKTRAVHFCTKRKAIRAYCAVPVATLGMLGADSFGNTAFNVKNEVERATLQFLEQCAACHVDLIETTRMLVGVAQIHASATAMPSKMPPWHALKCLYAHLLHVIQTSVGYVHCQQIVRLASDFTGDCTILCWHKAPTRRPMQHLPIHYCYRHRCVPDLVKHHVHLDDLTLPMSNIPKTLDHARSLGAPTTGLEPRGALPCFAGMLDGHFAAPCVAYCFYRKPGRPFAPRDVRFLNAVMHVAQAAYVNMYKALVVHTLAAEALQWAKDFVHAKDAMVVVATQLTSTTASPTKDKAATKMTFTVKVATNPDKFPVGVAMKKALKRTHRLASFAATLDVHAAMVPISTGAALPPLAVDAVAPGSIHPVVAPSTLTNTATISPKPTGGRFTTLFAKKRAAKDELARVTSPHAAMAAAHPAPGNGAMPPPSQHWEWSCRLPASQYLVVDITTSDSVDVDLFVAEGTALADTCRVIYDAFWANPRGNESFVGYFLTTWWHQAHVALGSARLAIEQQVRVYLDADVANKSTCPSSVITILCGALLCCGYKKDEFLGSKRAALQLFLAKQVASEVQSLDPFNVATKSKVWTAAFRSRTFLLAQTKSPLELGRDVTPGFRTLLHTTLLLQVVSKWLKADADKEKAVWTPLILAAIRIQCRARCRFAVAELRRRRRTYRATLVLQCFARQALARRHVQFRRETRAASRVQRWYRRRHEKKPAFATKELLLHMRAVQERFGLNDLQDTDAMQFGEATFEAFFNRGGGKSMVHAEAKRLLHKLKDLAKERASLPWEVRVDEDVRDLFEYFDYAGVGCISRDDAKTMIRKLRIPLQDDELFDVVNMMDSDKSGDVDVGEFCSWYKYEYARLRARSKFCGIMSNADKEWFAQGMAMRFVRQRWTEWRNNAKISDLKPAAPASPLQLPNAPLPPSSPPPPPLEDDSDKRDDVSEPDDEESSGEDVSENEA